jgi:PAS domain-containing protein
MELNNLGEISATIAAVFTALGLLWRYLFSPLWKLTKKLRNNSKEIARALPVLLAIARVWPQPESYGSLVGVIEKLQFTALQNKAWIKVFLEAFRIASYETTETGHCTWVSERWTEITGLSLQDSLGDGWVSGVDDKDRDDVFKEWKSCVLEKRLYDKYYHTVGGILVHGRGLMVRNDQGEGVGYVGILLEKDGIFSDKETFRE